MGGLGFQEILLIAIVILVLFGARKIPEFMKGIGKGISEFNNARDTEKEKDEQAEKKKEETKKAD